MKKINFIGPFNNTGYGHASLGYLECLHDLHQEGTIELNFIPIGPVNEKDPELSQPKYKKFLNYRNSNVDWSAISLSFWHLSHTKELFPQIASTRMGISTFEVNGLNSKELEAIASLDRVGFACMHNRQVAIESKVKAGDGRNIVFYDSLFHLQYDKVPVWNPDSSYLSNHFWISIEKDTTVLCNIGKFEARKGHYELLSALDILSVPIVLIGFWFNPFLSTKFPFSELINRNYQPIPSAPNCRAYKKGNKILILPNPVETRDELYSVAAKCSGYISASKAEGFNLPLYDIQSSGVPCISTCNTAMIDYIGYEGYYTRIWGNGVEPAFDGMFFDGKFTWEKIEPLKIAEAIANFINMKEKNRLPTRSYKDCKAHLTRRLIDFLTI